MRLIIFAMRVAVDKDKAVSRFSEAGCVRLEIGAGERQYGHKTKVYPLSPSVAADLEQDFIGSKGAPLVVEAELEEEQFGKNTTNRMVVATVLGRLCDLYTFGRDGFVLKDIGPSAVAALNATAAAAAKSK